MTKFYPASKSFLLGRNSTTLSYSGYKLAILTSQLSLLTFVISFGYIIFDLLSGIYDSWPLQSTLALFSLASFSLNKLGYYFPAKLTLGISTNLVIFFFSSTEPIETGLSFLFVICAIGAICTLGFEERKMAILFLLISLLLFVFSTVFDLEIFTRKSFSTEYAKINLIINFIATFVAAIFIFYFLLSLNYYSERSLRENEKKLNEKNEELVKVNSELDRFVYSTSHDLRSPISSMRGLIGLTKHTHDISEIKSYIEMMENQLINLNKFIGDISDYSRNSKVVLKPDYLNINNLVREILESLQFYPGAEKIDVSVNIPEDSMIKSDPTRVQIVLANLLSNAFKYSNHTNGNSFIKISTTETEADMEISILDNGFGIDSKYLPKIFDMFFQATEKSEGSGLGLYIAKETLERINGKIRVQSEVGVGTEFVVTLPKAIDGLTQG